MGSLRTLWLVAVLSVVGCAAVAGCLLVAARPELSLRDPAVLRGQAFDWHGLPVCAFDCSSMVVAMLLVLGSHVVPLCMPGRRVRPRVSHRFLEDWSYRESPTEAVVTNVVALDAASAARLSLGGVWAVAMSLCVVLIGVRSQYNASFHPVCFRANPAEFLGYSALALLCLLSHAPRLSRRRWRPAPGEVGSTGRAGSLGA